MTDGLALLDEAMVTAINSDPPPFVSGSLYCHTIAACHEIADFHRVSRWTDLTEDWLSTLPAVDVFGGLCTVHRAQLQSMAASGPGRRTTTRSGGPTWSRRTASCFG